MSVLQGPRSLPTHPPPSPERPSGRRACRPYIRRRRPHHPVGLVIDDLGGNRVRWFRGSRWIGHRNRLVGRNDVGLPACRHRWAVSQRRRRVRAGGGYRLNSYPRGRRPARPCNAGISVTEEVLPFRRERGIERVLLEGSCERQVCGLALGGLRGDGEGHVHRRRGLATWVVARGGTARLRLCSRRPRWCRGHRAARGSLGRTTAARRRACGYHYKYESQTQSDGHRFTGHRHPHPGTTGFRMERFGIAVRPVCPNTSHFTAGFAPFFAPLHARAPTG
jgi:hypothetical protein